MTNTSPDDRRADIVVHIHQERVRLEVAATELLRRGFLHDVRSV
jgi:hypothetical protein